MQDLLCPFLLYAAYMLLGQLVGVWKWGGA